MKSNQNFYLGTWQLSAQFGLVSEAQAKAILQYAWLSGIKYFDTAFVYGNGRVEELMGEVLPMEAKIVTKIPAITKLPANVGAIEKYYPRQWLENCFKTSLARLSKKSIYGVLLHNWSNVWSCGFEDVLAFLLDLKASGTVEKIGISIPNHFAGTLPSRLLKVIDLVEAPSNSESFWVNEEIGALHNFGIEVILRSLFLQGRMNECPNSNESCLRILRSALKRECSVVVGMTKNIHIDTNIQVFKEVVSHENEKSAG